MKTYGCIGKKLTHSFSKEIHNELADYEYGLIELAKEEIQPFFEAKDFAAINVTIPYKQTVIPYLDSVSDIARRIGAVNTIVNKDGNLYGYNTDYYGMKALIERVGVEMQEKKCWYSVREEQARPLAWLPPIWVHPRYLWSAEEKQTNILPMMKQQRFRRMLMSL